MSRPGVQAAAAMALAMKHDEAVLPYLLAWFHGDDQPHRNVAMQGVKADERKPRRALGRPLAPGAQDGWPVAGHVAAADLRRLDSARQPALNQKQNWRRCDGRRLCGVPFGEESWQRLTSERLGLQSTLRARGRPHDLPRPGVQQPRPVHGPGGQNSSRPGENVLDLFGGSGSTLIAATGTVFNTPGGRRRPACCSFHRRHQP